MSNKKSDPKVLPMACSGLVHRDVVSMLEKSCVNYFNVHQSQLVDETLPCVGDKVVVHKEGCTGTVKETEHNGSYACLVSFDGGIEDGVYNIRDLELCRTRPTVDPNARPIPVPISVLPAFEWMYFDVNRCIPDNHKLQRELSNMGLRIIWTEWGYFVGADDTQSSYSHLGEAAVKLGLAEQNSEVTG